MKQLNGYISFYTEEIQIERGGREASPVRTSEPTEPEVGRERIPERP